MPELRGLSSKEVMQLREQYGYNLLDDGPRSDSGMRAFAARFKNPLVLVLLVAASLSLFFGDRASFFIIVTIVCISIFLDFINTFRSERAAEALKEKVLVRARVIRDGKELEVLVRELVPGDVVKLDAGKIIPADGVIVESKDLFTNEAALTGESFPQAKPPKRKVFMGSGVISGEGVMQVTGTGRVTQYAHIAHALHSTHRPTEFEREIKAFSVLVIKITMLLVGFVLLANILFHRNFLESILFSLALAVGLTPELLPLIITLNLTKGSLRMAREGVIVKQLSAVQNFGSMDVLCTDKTGTLTEDKIELVKFVDGQGKTSDSVFELGYLVSCLSTSFENPLDMAVKNYKQLSLASFTKIDEIPFDFERKREAVVIHSRGEKRRLLIVKGAPEEVLRISHSYATERQALTPARRKTIEKTFEALSNDGFRVLAVATRQVGPEKRYELGDEKQLCFHGFLAFLDPAKQSVRPTLERMAAMGIAIKIITGDNALVTQKVARDINLEIKGVLTGAELSRLSRSELVHKVEQTNIFARVSPEQKMAIIQALQENGHVVGYMGDGINDAPSLRAADVGVSVNNAVDVAKTAADFILLRKNLHELTNGIEEGRKTFANTMKYLRMSLSSNFGNMLSMAGASLFLPFLPMLATQILLNNLLYDMSQFAIPLDRVDPGEVTQPHTLSIADIRRFMWSYGLLSSAFDFVTFGILLLVFHASQGVFQAGWFLESLLTQVAVVYIIRTRLTPFRESWPAPALVATTFLVAASGFMAVLLPIKSWFKFGDLTDPILLALLITVVMYLLSAERMKRLIYPRTQPTGSV